MTIPTTNPNENIGLSKDNPILLRSVPASYFYLNSLVTIHAGLSYERIGATASDHFEHPIDKYNFTINGEFLCSIYIYAYHTKSLPIIPQPFSELAPNITTRIFENNEEHEIKDPEEISNEDIWESKFRVIIYFILLKNGIITDKDVTWDSKKEGGLSELMDDLHFDNKIEFFILDAWEQFYKSSKFKNIDFIDKTVAEFHNSKLSIYTSLTTQKNNLKIEQAYRAIIKSIDKIQAHLDDETLRFRIENKELYLSTSVISLCSTPFAVFYLSCNTNGAYEIEYALDSIITGMLPSKELNKLVRSTYKHTSNELEGSVSIISFNYKTIKLFRNLLDIAMKDETFQVITVQKSEETILDILNNVKLNSDIDDRLKKWLN